MAFTPPAIGNYGCEVLVGPGLPGLSVQGEGREPIVGHGEDLGREDRRVARARLAENVVVAFFHQLVRIHFGRRHNPHPCRQTGNAVEHFAGCTVMTDIGHTRSDEDLIHFITRDLGQWLDIIRVVGAGQQRFGDLRHIDLDDLGVLGIRVGAHQ